MSPVNLLKFGRLRTLSLILQTEASECGLACLCMISSSFGNKVDLQSMRATHQISLKGANLAQIIKIAKKMNLSARPLRVELSYLNQIRLPCILHWNHNHFVVLESINRKSVRILNPASGIQNLTHDELSRCFTGIALELWPDEGFEQKDSVRPVKLQYLMGRVRGLKRSFGQILMMALALETFSVIMPLFVQLIIDNVVVAGDHPLLITLAIAFSCVLVAQQITLSIRSYVVLYMGTTLNVQWRANLFTHLMSLPIQYFEKRHVGDVMSRFGSIDQIQKTLTSSFLEAIVDGGMTVLTLGLMYFYSPLLSTIAVFTMLLYSLIRAVRYRPLREATQEQIVHSAKQQSHLLETIRGAKTIKLYQRQDDRKATWLAILADSVNADIRSQKLQIIYRLVNGSLFGFETVVIVTIAASYIIDGKMTIGLLTAFMSYKGQFDTRVSSLVDKYFDLKMLQLQAERLADIVCTSSERVEQNIDDESLAAIDASVEIKDVSFRYSEDEPFVFDGINIRISPGESAAIVGPSGCGKTTLLNIILGILSPTRGHVLIGGHAVSQIGIGALRSIVGTVLQDDVLFAGSIAENICFFALDPDMAWVRECADRAFISQDIEAMPMRYNTLVGDMGTALSGGQKQRILLARALYRRPRILILDEATSHLDVKRESEVNEAIKNLDITRIIVAHRPETIASADRIIPLG